MKARLGWILAVAALVGCSGTKSEGEAAVANEATESTTLAVVPYGNGKVMFIDEGRVIPGAGISFVEIGDVDLSDLLDVQNATALEVFMALSPKGVEPPQRLVEHHRQTALANVTVSATPRMLRVDPAKLTPSVLEPSEKSPLANCWGWSGDDIYDVNIGNTNYVYGDFKKGARIWSNFGPLASSLEKIVLSESGSQGLGETTKSTQRSLAVCPTQARIFTGQNLVRTCKILNKNRVFVRVNILADGKPAAEFKLEGFGVGGRFRSSLVNTGGEPRIYEATVSKVTPPDESGVDVGNCIDEVHGVWHWKFVPPTTDKDASTPPPM